MTHKIEARTWASKLRVLVDTEDGPQTVCEIPNPNPGELLSVVVGGWGDEVQTGYLRSVFVEPSGSQTIGELTQYEVNGVTPVRSAQGTTELPKVTATGGDIFEVVVDGEVKSRHSKQHVAQYEATKWEQASPNADVIYKKETVWRVEATPLDALPEVPDPLTRTDRNAAPYDVTVTPTDEPEEYNVSLLLRPSTGIPPTTPAVVLQPIAISVLEGDQQLTITLNDSGSQNHTGIELELDAVAVTGSPFAPGYSDPIVITGLTNDQAYSLTGRTTDGTNDSATTTESATPSAGGSAVDLQQPTNVQGSGTNQAVNVSFTNNSQNESGHEYSLDGTNWVAVPNSAGVGNIQITGLTNGQAYSGFIRPVDGSTKGPQSAEWFATPRAASLGMDDSFWNPPVMVPSQRGAPTTTAGPITDDQWMASPYTVLVDHSLNKPPIYGDIYHIAAYSEVGVDPAITDLASANQAVAAGRSQRQESYPRAVGRRTNKTFIVRGLKPATTYQVVVGSGSNNLADISAVRTITTLNDPSVVIPPVGERFGFPKADLDKMRTEYLAGDTRRVFWRDFMANNVGGSWYTYSLYALDMAMAWYMTREDQFRDDVARMTQDQLSVNNNTPYTGDTYRRLQTQRFMQAGEILGWDYGLGASANAALKNQLWNRAIENDNGNRNDTYNTQWHGSGDEDQQAFVISSLLINGMIMMDDPTYGADAAINFEIGKKAFYGGLLPRLNRVNADGNPSSQAGGRVAMNPEYAMGEQQYYVFCLSAARQLSPSYMTSYATYYYKQFLANNVWSVAPEGTPSGFYPYHDMDEQTSNSDFSASRYLQGIGSRNSWGLTTGAWQMGMADREGLVTEARYIKQALNDIWGDQTVRAINGVSSPFFAAILYDHDGISPLEFPSDYQRSYLDAGLGHLFSLNGAPIGQRGSSAATAGLHIMCSDSSRDHYTPQGGMVQLWQDGRFHFCSPPFFNFIFDSNYQSILRVNGQSVESGSFNQLGQQYYAGAPKWLAAEDEDTYVWSSFETDCYEYLHRRLVFWKKPANTANSENAIIVVDRLFRDSSQSAITQLAQNWVMIEPVSGTWTPLLGNSGPASKVRDVNTAEQWEIPLTISNDVLAASSYAVNGTPTQTAVVSGANLTLTLGSESLVVNKDTLEAA